MMSGKIIGYIRVSTDRQDLDKQRHLLLEYARSQRMVIDEFVEIEMSSRKSQTARRIDELIAKLGSGDLLLVAELSRLGREMLQVLNLINTLSEKGVESCSHECLRGVEVKLRHRFSRNLQQIRVPSPENQQLPEK